LPDFLKGQGSLGFCNSAIQSTPRQQVHPAAIQSTPRQQVHPAAIQSTPRQQVHPKFAPFQNRAIRDMLRRMTHNVPS
jgi:hypothetical protein